MEAVVVWPTLITRAVWAVLWAGACASRWLGRLVDRPADALYQRGHYRAARPFLAAASALYGVGLFLVARVNRLGSR